MSVNLNDFINSNSFGGFNLNNLIQPDLLKGYSNGSGDTGVVEHPEKLLEQTLTNRVAGFVPANEVENKSNNNFSPEAVAGRILDFVESSIKLRAGSDIEAQSLLQQAREGITQGFAEARDILSAIPNISEDVNSRVDDTENLIFEGLDRLDNLYSGASQPSKLQLISESASYSSQFKQTNEASLEIVTQDGDKVEISYSAFIQATTDQRYALDQKSASASYEYSAESSIAFQFSVQGDIDDGEKKAINNLLNDVGKLAEQFFQGDVQAAFKAAQELGFDSKELKSFALDFQQSTQIQVAQTYQRTESINQPITALPTQVNPGSAISLLAQLEDLITLTEENVLIENPEKTLKSLLNNMMSLLSKDFDMPDKKYIKTIIENF